MKVSIIVPSFNREKLIGRAIKSLMNQTFKNFEILIIDDASNDKTENTVKSIIKKFPKYDIKYIKHKKNKGEAGSRNTGIQKAKGELIAFLDSDDEWLRNKLMTQVNFLKKNTEVDGVVSEYFQVYDNKKIHVKFKENFLKIDSLISKGCGYGIGSCLLIKKNVLNDFFDEQLKLFVDMDWLLRILNYCTISTQNVPLTYYYQSPIREGDFVKFHAKKFVQKINSVKPLKSFLQKLEFYSTINWYIGVAYDANSENIKASFYFVKSMLLNPIRSPFNYFHIVKLILKSILRK